jgi:hypothetical protein
MLDVMNARRLEALLTEYDAASPENKETARAKIIDLVNALDDARMVSGDSMGQFLQSRLEAIRVARHS